MEPKLPAPSTLPEMGAYSSQVLPPHPEVLNGQQPEQNISERPAAQEKPAAPVQFGPTLPMVTAPASTVDATKPVLNPVAIDTTIPAVAADDEVIEKEWVDKAKKIVADTKDDPYTQEKAVSKLQADYLKKRYGKELKVTSD